MFTGIAEEVGTIKSINRGQHSAVLTVRAKTVLEGTRIGDSIAVNGICLTVRQLFPDSFAADVMHEDLEPLCTCTAHRWKCCQIWNVPCRPTDVLADTS